MKLLRNPKIRIWLTLGLSLFGLSVAGLSTFAWFQIETTKKTLDDNNTVKTVDPNIEIKNDGVMGYKIEPPIGANGFRDYSVTNVQSAAGSKVTVDNTNRAGENTDFDIPTEGVGYYLVKKTPGGLYRYTYDDDGDGTKETYASKFQMYESTYDSTTTAYIPSLDIEEGQEIRIRSYNFSSNKTEHKQVRVYQVYGAGTTSSSINATTGDVTVPTGGKYRVWLDYTDENWDSDATTIQCRLGFEPVSITSEGANVRARANVPAKEAKTDYSNSKPITQINLFDEQQWAIRTIKIDNVTANSGYSFEAFVRAYYGTDLGAAGTWSNQGTTKGYKVAGTAYYLCAGGTKDSTHPYSFPIPEWVTKATIRACGKDGGGSDKEIYVGQIENLHEYSDNGSSPAQGNSGNCHGLHINIYCKPSWNYVYNACSSGDPAAKDWGKTTVNLYAVNHQNNVQVGSTALAGTLELTKYYLLAPADVTESKISPVTYSGKNYQFYSGWYKTYSSGSALSSSFSTSLMTATTLNLYAYYDQVYAVNFFASFFIIDKDGTYRQVADSIPSESLGSTTSIAGETYNAPNSGYSDLIYKSDNTNGIYYRFARDTDGGNWFTDEDCDASTHAYSPSTTTGNRALYAKYVADVRETSSTHKTFYVDLRKCDTKTYHITWDGVKVWDTTNNNAATTGVKVAPFLYRVTIPTDIAFQVYNSSQAYGQGSNNRHMYAVDQSSGTLLPYENGKTILFIYDGDDDTHHTVKWDSLVSSSTTGTAVVEYYTIRWETLVEMHLGDQNDTNAFVYEHGYSVPLGTKIRISVTGGTYAGTYGEASDYATSLPFFLTQSGGGFVTQGYVGSAKFNFYLTTGSKVSMAMVPDLGNGYYIMNSKRASWNDAETAFKMSQYTTGMPADCSDQYKGVITFNAGDRFKIRSSDWLAVTYETDTGAFASGAFSVSNDANKDVNVVTGGKYVIYFKIKIAGGYSVYIASTAEDTNATTPDSSFSASSYYVVGTSDFSSGTATTGSSNVGFFGGLKMSSGSKVSAIYNGYYAEPNSHIYIRSYIDAVDTLYKAGIATVSTSGTPASGCVLLYGDTTEHTDIQLNTSTGVIAFGSKAGGYYNIYVYNGNISIEPFVSSDFFRLNPIDSALVTGTAAQKQAEIWRQKTAVILEVPFTCNNPYVSKISLGLENCPAYASAFLYCSTNKLKDPYDTLHGKESQSAYYNTTNLASYSAGTNLSDLNTAFSIPANSGETYYAYILIDYLQGQSYPTQASAAAQMRFYLVSEQQ